MRIFNFINTNVNICKILIGRLIVAITIEQALLKSIFEEMKLSFFWFSSQTITNHLQHKKMIQNQPAPQTRNL